MFPERIPESHMGSRASLWPLSDLKNDGDEPMTVGGETSVVRDGARIAVEDLYWEDAPVTLHLGDAVPKLSETSFNSALSQAQSSVLLTTELLEIILSYLPSTDLWRARYVCHSWSELVSTSPSLRRNLWFTTTLPAKMPTRGTSPRDMFKLNPVLDSLNLVKPSPYGAFRFATINFPARWRTVKAPWRELQLCEPPIQRLFLSSSWLDKYLECESGLTAGMIADRVELSRVGTLSSVHSG